MKICRDYFLVSTLPLKKYIAYKTNTFAHWKALYKNRQAISEKTAMSEKVL